MDPFTIQEAKNKFAEAQTPPIDPCTNPGCKFTGCTCGEKCGCDVPKDESLSCDPCQDFKRQKKLEMEGNK